MRSQPVGRSRYLLMTGRYRDALLMMVWPVSLGDERFLRNHDNDGIGCRLSQHASPQRRVAIAGIDVLNVTSTYSIRSERMLCEQLDYNLLFRWFIGLSMDDPVWDHSTFSKNRDRLLESDIARGLFDAILKPRLRPGT